MFLGYRSAAAHDFKTLSGFAFHYRGKTPYKPNGNPGILTWFFRLVKWWQTVVEVKYWQCCCLMQGLFAKSGMEVKSSLYPTEKRDAVFRGIGRECEVGEGDKQGQVCVPVSQLRCQLELPEEGRSAWFTSIIRKNIDQRGSLRGVQQSTILPFLSRALWVSLTLPLSVICHHMYFGKGRKHCSQWKNWVVLGK